ncbi:MAG: hypothetical protein ONB16_11055 [candidate division KSB1 bacterium]|nr:hypothetical protein [candidate division KSB1 bacterium]MDZ7317544.1 hypothetical protein [candidate division KSB1 bacterium]MDZ7340937.1 hypothetical protein [candidate division KSB1 bacterium]
MEAIVQKAMTAFGVPPHRPNFLFLLPAFFVAQADGKIQMKEVMSIGYNSVKLGLVTAQEEGSADFNLFLEQMVERFQQKTMLSDLDLLATAVNARLATVTPERAKVIRERIYQLCVAVADASGPLLGDKITPEEKQMLQRIFQKLEKES